MKYCGAGAPSFQETAHRSLVQHRLAPCPPSLHKLPLTPDCRCHTSAHAQDYHAQAVLTSPASAHFCLSRQPWSRRGSPAPPA